MNNNSFTSFFTNRRIIMVLSVLLIILFFVPSLKLSTTLLSSESFSWGMLNAAVGSYGQGYGDPKIEFFLGLLLPIGMLVVSFLRTIPQKTSSLVIGIISIVDIIMYIHLYSFFSREIFGDYGSYLSAAVKYNANFFFVLAILILLFLIFLSVMLYLNKLYFDGYFQALFTKESQQQTMASMSNAFNSMSNTMSSFANSFQQAASNRGGQPQQPAQPGLHFCPYCGKPVQPNYRFCPGCSKEIDINKFTQQ